MPGKRVDVVVVGGGIGGMTAALLLAEAGASVTLLERVAAPAEVGAGILLQANGLAVLEALGLGPALDRGGRRLGPPVLRSARGRMIGELATPPGGDRGSGRLLAIRRSRLYRSLLAAVSERPAIAARFGTEATAARPDGTVELRWRDRASSIAAGLVVGADGLRSTVRAGGDFGARVASIGRRYVRGLVARQGASGGPAGPSGSAGPDGPDPGAGHDPGGAGLEGEYWTPLGLFGGAPVDEATTYFYAAATHPSVAAALAARDLAAFRELWSAALPPAAPVLAGVGAFDELLVNDVVRVDCRRWSDGRLVLLGDAAHAMAPNLGQGANSAMVDAAVLAAELAGDRPVGQALDRYQARRQAAVRRVQDRADQLARLSGLANPLLCLARDAVLRRLSRSARAAARVDAMVQQEDPDALADAVRRLSGERRRPG